MKIEKLLTTGALVVTLRSSAPLLEPPPKTPEQNLFPVHERVANQQTSIISQTASAAPNIPALAPKPKEEHIPLLSLVLGATLFGKKKKTRFIEELNLNLVKDRN